MMLNLNLCFRRFRPLRLNSLAMLTKFSKLQTRQHTSNSCTVMNSCTKLSTCNSKIYFGSMQRACKYILQIILLVLCTNVAKFGPKCMYLQVLNLNLDLHWTWNSWNSCRHDQNFFKKAGTIAKIRHVLASITAGVPRLYLKTCVYD